MTVPERIVVSIGVVMLVVASVTGFIGWCLDNEFLFNFGMCGLFLILPVYVGIAIVIFSLLNFFKKDK